MSKYRIKIIEQGDFLPCYYPQVKNFWTWWYLEDQGDYVLTLSAKKAFKCSDKTMAEKAIAVYNNVRKIKKKVRYEKVILTILLIALPLFLKAQIQDSTYENWSTKQDSMAKANLERLVEYREDNKKVVKKLLLMGSAIGFFLTVYKRRKDE